LRIGTRRSRLALAQAEEVRLRLLQHGVDSEIVPMSTSGDEGAPSADAPAGLKGLFVDTILDALERGEIDVAVHSAKDLPAEDDDGLVIAAVPPRVDPADVLVLRDASLRTGAVIGTSSIRRRAQLLRAFPGVNVSDLRGNVDTRLRKVTEGVVDAAVLALAGLIRLGVTPPHSAPLGSDVMVPAPGQGALALQARGDDLPTLKALAPLDHAESRAALEAERSLMWRIGGGCALPLGALATVDGARIEMLAVVISPDGSRIARVEVVSDSPEGAAALATKELIAEGAEEILGALEDEG
ncbi:MAG: hydroxymethylbilane synthase, partial [Actinomycetota bacterium]